MALITRVSRLFAADMNAVIDHIEEPELLLKQSLREMQEAVAVSEQRLKHLHVQCEQVEEHCAQTNEQQRKIAEELAVCLDAQNDDLARAVIRRQLENEVLAQSLSDQHSDLSRELTAQRQLVSEQMQDLKSLQQKADLLSPVEPGNYPLQAPVSVTDDQVEVALLKEKQRRAQQ